MGNLTQVYLIRHSEQLKIENKIVKNEESQISNEKIILSVEGEKKAQEISKLKELSNIDILWSSNYVRAIATAKYIAKQNHIEINIDENFNERKLRRFKKTRGVGKNKTKLFYSRAIIRWTIEKCRWRK